MTAQDDGMDHVRRYVRGECGPRCDAAMRRLIAEEDAFGRRMADLLPRIDQILADGEAAAARANSLVAARGDAS